MPLIRTKLTNVQWETVKNYALAGVQAAEIIFDAQGKGEEKLEWVSSYIESQCKKHGIKIDMEDVYKRQLLYGYQTAEGFGKAFKQYHGCTPLEAKSPESTIRYFNPVVIKLAKRGGILMDYEPYQEKADSVTAYYDASDELHRLTRSKHAYLEYFVTMQYLEKVIPQNKMCIRDR